MNPNFVMAALYVGDLHPYVTEPMLLEKFSPAGPIHSIRVCRDRKTGSSLGYAYINFHHRADAERALEMLNFELLMGRPMRVMWSQRDSSLRKTGIGNLFINNLDKSIDSMALYDTFSIFGKILSCKVVGHENASKMYGYVHFESPEAADYAMERLNGKLLNNRKVFIEHFKLREERKAEAGPHSQGFTNVYIRNLGEDVDDSKLKEIFSKFGPMQSVRVMTDENGKSKGFGFVRFERHEDAQRTVTEMNGKELNGKQLYVGRAQSKEEKQTALSHKFEQGLNLYVKNLDDEIDDECLRMTFSQFGTITSAKVMMENGRSRGFGFVSFSSSQEATKARMETNGRMWGRKLVYVSVAQRRDERQAWLAHHNMQRMASIQAQNLSAYYTPSQIVEPCPDLHWTAQTIQPQNVQNMPDVAQPAPVHQQTIGTITPSNSQVPCMTEEGANTTTATSVPVADSVPSVEKDLAVDSVPDADTVPSIESVPAADTVPSIESVPDANTGPSIESVPEVDTVPAAEFVPAVDTVPAAESVPAVDTLPAAESVPAVDTLPAVDEVTAPTQAPGPDEAPSTSMASESSVQQDKDTTDVPMYPPAGKQLTIYMLESAPVHDQIKMTYDYMLPLVEKIHPTLANKITWMLVGCKNNSDIINMIGDPELLRASVDEMDMLLKAREAGHKPETLKMLDNSNNSNKKKRKNRKNN